MSAQATIHYAERSVEFLQKAEKLLEAAKAAQAIPVDCKPSDVGHLNHIIYFLDDAIRALDPN